MEFVVDNRSGRRVEAREWVARFDEVWRAGQARQADLLALLGPDIRLAAPGLRPTRGIDAARRAFEQTFELFPDLTAEVKAWAAAGGTLFIEMEFAATIGSGELRWKNVDRFSFVDGVAVERVAFFNPGKLRRALLASPAGWRQLLKRIRSKL